MAWPKKPPAHMPTCLLFAGGQLFFELLLLNLGVANSESNKAPTHNQVRVTFFQDRCAITAVQGSN